VPSDLLDETRWERWERRALSGPVLLAATPLYLASLPITLAGAAIYDAAHRNRWTTSRFAAALGVNLGMHTAAFAGVFASWLMGGRWAGQSPERELAMEHKLQNAWAHLTWELCAHLYQLDLEVHGTEQASPGPVLILPRHASLVDTLLPLLLISREEGLRLRYVMKRELLWDPVLDAIGHRWPTAFVRRGTRSAHEIEHVLHLADELGASDAIVLFPEGTRFSSEKRQHILDGLRSNPERFEKARRLRHVLPPHGGGVLALLDALDMDVVFIAHTGLEGANHFEDLLAGSLIGAKVKVEMWRVSHQDIPTGSSARIAWLEEQWLKVDRWIEEHRREGACAR
jgi:1-acyl-sn-glycerol-3-phosphate acyltransferase